MIGDATPDRWRRVEGLLHAALEQPSEARDAFLTRECAGDDELRREVASLLVAHEGSGLVDRLSSEVVTPLVARLHAPAEGMEGRRVGRFEVFEVVGAGGMGAVYRARDHQLGRDVALKFLAADLGADPVAKERFALEARAAAALDHPNVCTVYEVGETQEGRLFIAMPYYDGETLQSRIARGPLPLAEAVDVAAQMARGLAKAHARGIVHRDIKPSNVMLTSDGIVKLLDFGVAKLADVRLTVSGVTVGTVLYMSPEQARGTQVDHRADLWSLGVVLYEMLAGRRPYTGSRGEVHLSAMRRGDLTPVARDRADVPPGLEDVVRRLLAVEPGARFQSAIEVERALLDVHGAPAGGGVEAPPSAATSPPTEPARAQTGSTGRVTPQRVRARGWWLVVFLALAAAAAGAWWMLAAR